MSKSVGLWHRLGTPMSVMGGSYEFQPCPEDPQIFEGIVPIEVAEFLEGLGTASRYKEMYIVPTDLPEDFGSALPIPTEDSGEPVPKRRGGRPRKAQPEESK